MPVRKDTTARGGWHIEICQQGQRVHRHCAEGTTAAQAKQLETKLKKELFDNHVNSDNKTIADALAHFVDKRLARSVSYKYSLCHVTRLAEWVKGKRLSDAPAVAEAFKEDAQADYKPATINRSLAALRCACHIAFNKGWVEQPVHLKIQALPENNKRHVYLTKAEILRLVAASRKQYLRDAILILSYTGLRVGEMMRLTQDNIVGDSIRIGTSKNDDPRSIPIVPIIRDALTRLPFTETQRNLSARFVSARRRAKMDHVHMHDLRHTTASLLVQSGVSLYIVGEILGHRSTQTTKRYSHLNDDAKREAMKKIA